MPSYRPIEGRATDSVRRSTPGEPTGAITLREALGQALLKNPELATFSWEVRAMDARILQAELLPNPEFEAEVENFGGSNERRGFDSAESTFALSQLVELGGKRDKRARIARLERDLAGWDYEAKRLDIYVTTAKAFVATLAAQRRTELKADELALAERVRDTVAERVRAGRASSVEGTKANVELGSGRIDMERAKRELEGARDRLAAAWGGTAAHFSHVVGRFDDFSSLPPLPDLLKQVSENPDIARSDKELELRRSNLDLERAQNIPDITFSAGVRRYEDSNDSAFVAGVSIPIPIFGLNRGGVLEAERRILQQRERRRATTVGISSTLKQAYREAVALYAEVTTLKKEIVPGAQRAFDAVQQGYRQGKFDFLEVLDAQRTLFSARERYLETAEAYHKATLDIERLTGQPLAPSSSGTR